VKLSIVGERRRRLNGRFNAFSEVAGPIRVASPGFVVSSRRTIFTAIEGQSTPGGTGPYFAF
jgi:hypothetical protein